MRTLDSFVLGILQRFADAVYERYGIKNHHIGNAFLILALLVSIGICLWMTKEIKADLIPEIAEIRRDVAIGTCAFFLGMILTISFLAKEAAVGILHGQSSIWLAIFVRWLGVLMFVINIIYASLGQSFWWEYLDALFLSVGIMFWSLEPIELKVQSIQSARRRTFSSF